MKFPEKKNIEKRFSSSSATYNTEAVIQKSIISDLISYTLKLPKEIKNNVLEIGCGTGLLTIELINQLKPNSLYINDLVLELQKSINDICKENKFENYNLVFGDAETIKLPNNLSLIISASTFQWFHNLSETISKLSNVLLSDGYLVFSTFGPSNFIEIRELTGVSLKYLSFNEIKEILSKHFDIIFAEEKIMPLWFNKPESVLRHIKKTGVNSVSNNYYSKSIHSELINNYYDKFSNIENKVSLTYNPLYFYCRKK